MTSPIRERLQSCGKTQVWLIHKLAEKGVSVSPSDMSYILSGVLNTPKAQKVIELCGEILDETEETDHGHTASCG